MATTTQKNSGQIYLDYNASTPVDPQVAAVMQQAMQEAFGNPSSTHWAGVPAHTIVETARQQVADLLGCSAKEIVFTSGGSESNNLALKGLYFRRQIAGAHIITTQIEHPSIVAPCRFLERLGARITWLPVDETGRVNSDHLQTAIASETILISIMHANNEVGTIQPIEELAQIARKHDIPFHTDAAQSVGKVRTRVEDLGVDLLTIAGHKLYAPKGIGALYVRNGIELEPLIHGANHESGRRAGTESAMLTAALGIACELASDLSAIANLKALRNRLWVGLQKNLGDRVVLNGHPEKRLPNTLNVSFIGQVGAAILEKIPEIAASTGSACHAGRVELSPVLKAMGVSEDTGAGAIRFSLGRTTTAIEIDAVVERLIDILEHSN
jgi:cysteine desulfurase